MKRNTYVTAALFVVFGLLTVVYWQMGERQADEEIPIAATLRPQDDVTANAEIPKDAEDVDADGEDVEDAEDADAMAEAEDAQDSEDSEETEEAEVDAEAMAEAEDAEHAEDEASADDAGAIAEVIDEDADANVDESSREVISSLDALRDDLEHGRSEQVGALTDIIASADFDPETKSAAKDSLNELQALANSSRMLETVIGHMGFEDVLVRASADFVQITVQVSSLEDAPTRDELAELYVLAGIEFGAHRNGNISIDFQPLN